MWSRAATPRTSTTGSRVRKHARDAGGGPTSTAMRALKNAEEKERVWRNPYTFFCVPTEHPRMRRCQIWICSIPQMEGPHFIFISKICQGRNFIFKTNPNPYRIILSYNFTKPLPKNLTNVKFFDKINYKVLEVFCSYEKKLHL